MEKVDPTGKTQVILEDVICNKNILPIIIITLPCCDIIITAIRVI